MMQIHPFLDWTLIQAGCVEFLDGKGKALSMPESKDVPYGIKIASQPAQKSRVWLKADRPWESMCIGGYTSVIYEGDKYRLWYESYADDYKDDFDCKLCYAESKDGFNWHKPNLGLVDFKGSKENNMVYNKNFDNEKAFHGVTVFKDPSAPIRERYKLIYEGQFKYIKGVRTARVKGAVSPDGLHWISIKKPLLDNYFSDTQTTAYYDSKLKSYIGYFRGWTSIEPGSVFGRRIIKRGITKNFRKWSVPKQVLSLGINHHPSHDLYTNAHTIYPERDDLHLLFPSQYNRENDTMEVYLAISQNGVNWEYFGDRPIIPLGEKGSGEEGSIYAGCGIVPLDKDRIAIPYSGFSCTHNLPYPPYAGQHAWAMWLKDRLVAVEAEEEGRFSTYPVINSGNNILLNFTTKPAGYVKVQLKDQRDKPIKGYSFSDCDYMSGDFIDKSVTWKGVSSISRMKGKPVKIEFLLNQTKIYAFYFKNL